MVEGLQENLPLGPRASDYDTHNWPESNHIFDAIIVGGGPGGCASAIAMAQRGLDVLLLEKDEYPREKVCGDGLTPRTVRMLQRLKIDTSVEAGWTRNVGLRVHGGCVSGMELAWPKLNEIPDYGLTCRRAVFDDLLAGSAIKAGATLVTGVQVEGLLPRVGANDQYEGVVSLDGRKANAPVIVLADGNSSRMSRRLGGFECKAKRPLGVAVRTYYRTSRPTNDHLESWLELWDGVPGQSNLMPGYGWLFDLGDGTVNIGLGMLNTAKAFGKTDYRELLKRWVASLPPEWGISEETRLAPIAGSALPMGINRRLQKGGCLLVGDAAGMISPFNGEGISYAMEAGEMAAESVAEAQRRGFRTAHGMAALTNYPRQVRRAWGGYFRLGTIFSRLVGIPAVMQVCTRYGLPRKRLMKFVHKMLGQLTDQHAGSIDDKILNALARCVPPV